MPITKELLQKARKKFLQIAERNIPYNLSYRPTGLYRTSKEYINATASKAPKSKYIEIYPNLVTKLTIDEEVYNAITAPLKPTLEVETTYIVTALENGRVFTDYYSTMALISGDNKLIADISFSYTNGRKVQPQENAVFSQKYFTKPVKYKGTVFCMLAGQGAITNYGHWLIDTLPRLHLLKKSGLYDSVNWFLVPNYQYDFHKDTLKLLGIDESKVIIGNTSIHIQADVLIGTTAPRGNYMLVPNWVCNFLRKSFLDKITLQTHYPSLVYISRRDSEIRRVINEEEVYICLKDMGLKPMY